jgi:hypothetical protein
VRVPSRGAAPSAAMFVTSTIADVQDNGISFRIAGTEGDIVLCLADETAETEDLNGDGDQNDTAVLAALDAGDAVPALFGTGLAVASTPVFDVAAVGTDWLVAFLVSEAAQVENLNDPTLFAGSWQPGNCAGRDDTDQLDHVLHWFEFSDLVANARVTNTGLVGNVSEPVLAHPSGFVAVVSLESDEGNGGCDLNGDGDFVDPIFRWVDATTPGAPVLPVTSSTRLLAVARNNVVPGNTGGMLAVGDAFVIVVNEAADGRDYDGDAGTDRNLVAAHVPASSGQSWNFQHGSGTPAPVAVSWVGADPRVTNRFGAAITEDGRGADINGDGDESDSVPTFPTVLSGNVLGFPGVAVAAQANNAGVSFAANHAFYRVSETADGSTDRNGDGDANDQVLQRVALTGSTPVYMGSLNTQSMSALPPNLDGTEFGAFLYEEAMFGTGNDLNGDGDTLDIVVRYFRLP